MKFILVCLCSLMCMGAIGEQTVAGYDFITASRGEIPFRLKSSIEYSVTHRPTGVRYQLVQLGCGTECAVWAAVIDFQDQVVYELDNKIDAIATSSASLVLEFEAIIVQNQQRIFTDEGVYGVQNNEVLSGRPLASLQLTINSLAHEFENERYIPVNVGCGTECYVLMSVVDQKMKMVIPMKSPVSVYRAEEYPLAIITSGKKFVFDGKTLKEFDWVY